MHDIGGGRSGPLHVLMVRCMVPDGIWTPLKRVSKSLIIEGSFCSSILAETPTFPTVMDLKDSRVFLTSRFRSVSGQEDNEVRRCPKGAGYMILLVVVNGLAWTR